MLCIVIIFHFTVEVKNCLAVFFLCISLQRVQTRRYCCIAVFCITSSIMRSWPSWPSHSVHVFQYEVILYCLPSFPFVADPLCPHSCFHIISEIKPVCDFPSFSLTASPSVISHLITARGDYSPQTKSSSTTALPSAGTVVNMYTRRCGMGLYFFYYTFIST